VTRQIRAMWKVAVLVGTFCYGCAPSTEVSANSTGVKEIVKTKGKSMGPVAIRIARFKDAAYVTSLAFSPDNKQLATNYFLDLNVRIWNWQGVPAVAVTLQKPAHSLGGEWDALRYSQDGAHLAIAHPRSAVPRSPGSYTRVWNTTTWAVEEDLSEPTRGLAAGGLGFYDRGQKFASAVHYTTGDPDTPFIDNLAIYRTADWTVEWSLLISPHIPNVLEVNNSGTYAAVDGYEVNLSAHTSKPQVLVIDLLSRKRVLSIDLPSTEDAAEKMSWSADGTRLAVAVKNSTVSSAFSGSAVLVYDRETGRLLTTDQSSINSHIEGLNFTVDGKYLVEGGLKQSIRIWDAAQSELLQTIAIDPNAMTVSNDGGLLAIAEADHVEVWKFQR